jgi:hypothetical protein
MTADPSTPGRHRGLTQRQFFALNWLMGIVISIILVPLELEVAVLAMAGQKIELAISHGELYLVSANAVVASAIVLMASRLDDLVNSVIAAFVAVLTVAAPAYGVWAFAIAQSEAQGGYSLGFAANGGWVAVTISLLISGRFVRLASRSVPTTPADGA